MNCSLAVGGQIKFIPSVPSIPADLPSIAEPVLPHGVREVIQYRCAQLGILCTPLINRFHDGRPIFRVGHLLCHFDRQVPFLYSGLRYSKLKW